MYVATLPCETWTTEKPTKFTMSQKTNRYIFVIALPMPTNLSKILDACRLVNWQTNVKKFVSKNEDIPKINNRPKFYMIFARKSNKIPIMYMIFD